MQAIGRSISGMKLPAEAISPARSSDSATGASTRPTTNGASGTLASSSRTPSKPKPSITQISNARLLSPNAPSTEKTITIGRMKARGTCIRRAKNAMPNVISANIARCATRCVAKIVFTISGLFL